MTEEDDARVDPSDLQNPLVHEGALAEALDTNEAADERATVVQPSGEEIDPSND